MSSSSRLSRLVTPMYVLNYYVCFVILLAKGSFEFDFNFAGYIAIHQKKIIKK